MDTPILTVAIPCYNVAHCIDRCLNSLRLDETMGRLDVLCIDDGSTDATASVLQDYASQFPHTVRVIHKPNGGWGTAVNLAIEQAQGIYFKELDADDAMESAQLLSFLDTLEKIDCDFVATPYADILPDGTHVAHHFDDLPCNKVFSIADFWNTYPNGWRFPIHAITYRTSFIQQLPLRVGPRYYTDFEYFLYPMPHVQSIAVLPHTVTLYSRGLDEQSTSASGYARHWTDFAALSLRLAKWDNALSLGSLLAMQMKIQDTIQGTIRFAYELQLRHADRQTLCSYDRSLHEVSPFHWELATKARLHSVPYIALWRHLGINLLRRK
ncbi:MAG: glycosyltransferase family 2 protein [Bacteroidales bacterium]|nr:glycosyltransferase family 2 protein [Bacteroidales bacterium]